MLSNYFILKFYYTIASKEILGLSISSIGDPCTIIPSILVDSNGFLIIIDKMVPALN